MKSAHHFNRYKNETVSGVSRVIVYPKYFPKINDNDDIALVKVAADLIVI